MKKIAFVAVLVLATAGGAVGSTSQQARLRIVDSSPLTVRGTQFKPSERVKVSYVTVAGTLSRRVTAGAGGSFTARFERINFNICSAIRLFAVGSLGSHASVKFRPILCPQPVREP